MRKKLKEPPIMDAIGYRVKDRPPRAKKAHLDDDDKLVIIWGLSRGWTAEKIARTLPASGGRSKTSKPRFLTTQEWCLSFRSWSNPGQGPMIVRSAER